MIIYCSSNLVKSINNDIQANNTLSTLYGILVYIFFGVTLITFLFLLFFFELIKIPEHKYLDKIKNFIPHISVIFGILGFTLMITLFILRAIIYNKQINNFNKINVVYQSDSDQMGRLIDKINNRSIALQNLQNKFYS